MFDFLQIAAGIRVLYEHVKDKLFLDDFWPLTSQQHQKLLPEDQKHQWFMINPSKLKSPSAEAYIIDTSKKHNLLKALAYINKTTVELPEDSSFLERLLYAKRELPPILFTVKEETSKLKFETMQTQKTTQKQLSIAERYLSGIIFSSRWLQSPLYFGLIIAQFIYVYLFLVELWGLAKGVKSLDENHIMLIVLDLIDVVMISNLLVMVIIGGYETFVSKIRGSLENSSDVPEWLNQVNPNTIKIKVSMSLIGISSIHLLKTFINVKYIPTDQIMWQVIIHITFLISALALAYTAKLSHTHAFSKDNLE